MTGEEKEGEKVATGYPAGGEKPASKEIYQGIEKIFERAEHARHKEHAEEFLDKLVREEIYPLMGDGFVDYDEYYDDFQLLVEWWDYDEEGRFGWRGTLQYFIHYHKDGKYLNDDELAREVKKIRKDLLRRIKEREQWAKEVEKRLEDSEVEKND
jgi:hypothetical protein